MELQLPPLRPQKRFAAGVGKARDFIVKAFTIIFLATIVIWFMQTFDARLNVVEDSSESLMALVGKWIAPVFKPLGFDDWRIATSLISGLAAKEAVVGTMGVLLGVKTAELSELLSALFTPLSAISFLLFTLLYTPCVAAIATIRRELNSKIQTLGVVLLQCGVAWVVAFAVYQIGRLFIG